MQSGIQLKSGLTEDLNLSFSIITAATLLAIVLSEKNLFGN